MRLAFAALALAGLWLGSIGFAAEPLAAPAEKLIADLNTAIGHDDWRAAAALFKGVPAPEALRVAFRGSETWSELGPARVRINAAHRVSDSEIAIDAVMLQPGSVTFRADPVEITIRRTERGWRIASWRVLSPIPLR